MAAISIICLGNRFVPGDDLGCRVYDCLMDAAVPQGIEIVDGGLCGLDLLRQAEGRERVVFVDALTGMAETGKVVVLSREQVVEYASHYGHGAGLPYLLYMLPKVCAAPLPEIVLMGAESVSDEAVVRTLAERSVGVAIHGTS